MKSVTRQTLSIYWQHAVKYKKQLWIIYPLMTVAQLAEDFLSPLLISIVLNNLASGNLTELTYEKVLPIMIGVVVLEAIAHIIWNVMIRVYWRTQEKIMHDLTMTCFTHLQSMSFRFFSDRFAGSLVSQTNKFITSFERLTDPLTWNVYKLIVGLVLTNIILLPKAPIVSFAIIVIVAVYVPVIWQVRRKQIPLTTKWSIAETKRTGQLADSITNVMAVKSFSNEKLEKSMMKDRADTIYDRSMDTMKLNMKQEFGTGAIQRMINLSVIILSLVLAVNGSIEVGTIYLALTFTLGIMRRLWDLNNTFRNITRVFGDASDMTEILHITPEVQDINEPKHFSIGPGSVAFDDVTFKYTDSGDGDTLFSELNLEIKPGEKIGLVGPSGGGKTTITKLLMRFMDIQNGSIKIDEQDIALIKQKDLRTAISYVPQEPQLFHRTLSENIAYGKLDATQEEIEAAAKKAHAHEFIETLADGYDTLVGERGVKLSGGQRQRVVIARSMLKDAPILVLDEATSALDSESEQLIQDALWKLMEGKTAIVIAHRLSTIQRMDRIIVLSEGKIMEQGSHLELIKKKNGLYARLWKHQSGGFLQD